MNGAVEVRLLGPLEVLVDGALVSVGRANRAEVVAFLGLHADEVVPVESLAEALWDSDVQA